MADDHELQHAPRPESSSIVVSETRSRLIARGRNDASDLRVRKSQVKLLARVGLSGSRRSIEGGKFIPSVIRFGLIDRTGEFITEPAYPDIQPFSCGLAAFSVSALSRKSYMDVREELFNSDHGLWGYLDHAGAVVIAPRFERVRNFSEDMAGVEVDGKWGFILTDGTFAIEPRFAGVRDFKDGLAVARLGERCGLIDRSGAFVLEPQFAYLWEFSEGLACADIGGKYGYVDRSGVFAIAPKFDSSQPSYLRSRDFRQGVAIAVGADGLDCVINRAGGIVFKCAEDGESIGEFTDGIARVSEARGNWDNAHFIDSRGRPLINDDAGDEGSGLADVCDAAEDFSNGFGLVAGSYAFTNGDELWPLRRRADRNGSIRLYGYIDTQGKMRIPIQFHSARPFKNGLAGVDPNGDKKYGFIDTGGNMVIETRFTQVGDFKNGMARVKEDTSDGKWGFIDGEGNLVVPSRFDRAEDFEEVTPSLVIKD